MIYDKLLGVYSVEPGLRPTDENLTLIREHFYAEKTISHKRFCENVQAGHQVDLLVEIQSHFDYIGMEYVKIGSVCFELIQAEKRLGSDGLPVTWLSLCRHSRTWGDTITLLSEPTVQDSAGYLIGQPLSRSVCCSIVSGIDGTQSESGNKLGLRRSAAVEIYSSDFHGERKASFRGLNYDIASAEETSRFTLRLTLKEAVR